MFRICVYHHDMGKFRRSFIQTATADELARLQKSEYHRVLVLPEEDWYGMSAPQVWEEAEHVQAY